MLTVSKALLISRATITVLAGGLFSLKPLMIVLFMLWSAVVVECFCLKPCWYSLFGMFCVMWGSMTFSSVLAIGDSSDIGRKEVPMPTS